MSSGFKKTFLVIFFLFLNVAASGEVAFTFNGFHGANLNLDGISSIESNGLLELTNSTINSKGHAFHPKSFNFKSSSGKVLSFSTTFIFGIISNPPNLSAHGLAFVISRTNNLSTAFATQYLGILNSTNNGNSTNHILAIELDTIQNPEFQDVDDNHLGIDIDNMTSYNSSTAGYYLDTNDMFQNLSIKSGQPMQVWIDFDGDDMQLNVTLAPVQKAKPHQPLLSSIVDLSSLMLDSMYVGFSSATGNAPSNHYVLGWSFKMNGSAEFLDYSKLPKLPPQPDANSGGNSKKLAIWLPLASCSFVVLVIVAIVGLVRRRLKYAELFDDWEVEYGPHRFSYKDLFRATKGFKDSALLGVGGFGRVYRGFLRTSNIEIAVKIVSHESGQGMKEFVAEILSIGQLRHRNIVQLLGYCRRKGELLLVYDFMPNGSLDKFLYDPATPNLDWNRRFQIIKGVASGLLYLHEGWEKVVIHRDIKSSNVLLDSEMNGKLGDFGLAKLYDHGTTNPQTTHVVGTMGYIAPEVASTGKATTSSDVFAFGVFLLEITCGRSALESGAPREQEILVDWVLDHFKRGVMIATIDARLGDEHSVSEMEMVLKLGLLCSHPIPAARPSMRQVMQFLDGDAILPELSLPPSSLSNLSLVQNQESSVMITMPDFSGG